jgi:hypothetical protein
MTHLDMAVMEKLSIDTVINEAKESGLNIDREQFMEDKMRPEYLYLTHLSD